MGEKIPASYVVCFCSLFYLYVLRIANYVYLYKYFISKENSADCPSEKYNLHDVHVSLAA